MKKILSLLLLVLFACGESETPQRPVAPDFGVWSDVAVTYRPDYGATPPDVSVVPPAVNDERAPQWPAGATLTLERMGDNQLSVGWPEASDDTAVVGYFIFIDGRRALVLGPEARQAVVEVPTPGQTVRVSVIARDEAHNRSDPLFAEHLIPDEVPPSWPADARLIARDVGLESAMLSWTAASDHAGEVRYEVMWDEVPLAEGVDTTSVALVDLTPDTDFTVQVYAVDSAGLRAPGPISRFRTLNSAGPHWGEAAQLGAEQVGPSTVTLSWPEAQDADGVAEYLVYKDGIVWTQTPLSEAVISDLTTPSRYRFAVRAADFQGRIGDAELGIEFDVEDRTPPEWSNGASIRLRSLTETSAVLQLPSATDNDRVTGYRVEWGADPVVTREQRVLIDGLAPRSEYTIRVVALDDSGNATESALERLIETPDLSPPTWPENASISASWLENGRLTIQWPSANDRVGIARYWVQVNADEPIDTGVLTRHDLVELAPGRDHRIAVLAEDLSGQRSAHPLVVVVRRPNVGAPVWPAGARLLVSELQETSLRLAWPPARDDSGELSYRIRWGDTIRETPNTEIELADLLSGQAYQFSVSAYDEEGRMTASGLDAAVRMPDYTSPTWPADAALRVSQVGETFVALTWDPAFDHVDLAGYEITLGDATQRLDADTTDARFDDLRPGADYQVSVRAFDGAGNVSGAALSLTMTTADTTPPLWPDGARLGIAEVRPDGAEISWPVATDNAAVTGYVLVVDDGAELVYGPDTQQVRVDSWQPWRTYRVRVFAQDSQGQRSPPLEGEAFTPDVQSPTWGVGAGLALGAVAPTQVDVSWPAAQDDVAIAGYRLFIDGVPTGDFPADTRATQLNALQPAQMILIELMAYDPAGNEGERLRLSVQTPDGGPPVWPVSTLQWTADLNRMTLTWPAAEDDVEVIGYRVIVDGAIKLETPALNALIEGLEPGHSYEVRIDAGDAAGHWSEDGPADVVRTPERAYEGFRRLSRDEYTRSVAHLMQYIFGTPDDHNFFCNPALGATRAGYCRLADDFEGFSGWLRYLDGSSGPWLSNSPLSSYPEETAVRGEHELGGGFSRLDQRLFDEHIGVWTKVAGEVSQVFYDANDHRVFPNNTAWGTPYGAASMAQRERCFVEFGVASSDDFEGGREAFSRACFSQFVRAFGSVALRRPMSDEEYDVFMADYDNIPQTHSARFELERQLNCWLEVNQPRWQHPKPNPWVWAPGDEDWCAQVAPEAIDTMYPENLHLEVGMVELVPILMMAPEFVYHVETGDEQGNLTAHELANRLAFHFWKQPPDIELRALADDDSLLDPAVYAQQVERLFTDARAEAGVRSFYHGYFWEESVPNNLGDFVSRWYLQGTEDWHPMDLRSAPSWYSSLHPFGDSAKAELNNLGHYFTREEPGTFREMFMSNLNFMECQSNRGSERCGGAGPYGMFVYQMGNCADYHDCIDRIWGPDTETGYRAGTEPVVMVEPNRFGVLTRIGFLMHETLKERPIRRGLKIRNMLLCDPIPPPENCDVVRVPKLTGLCAQDGQTTGRECSHDSHCDEGQICEEPFRQNTMTVRDVVEEVTEQEGTSCATCHARWINGMGHALGNYSSQGLYRTHEPMFSPTNRWSNQQWVISNQPRPQAEWPEYNTQGQFRFDGELVTVEGAEQLAEFLADSGRLESCWAQQYFRYTMGRLETASDLATIESLADRLRSGEPLSEVFKGIAFTEAFKSISKPPRELSSEAAP